MKFCIPLAFNPTKQWADLAQTAEESGFEAMVVSDHLFYPGELKTPYPYTPDGQPLWESSTAWPDPLIAIAALSAMTQRLRFITAVYVLPLRHPVVAAKAIATAELLSQGRLTLGVGSGWMREEFELLGQAFERRGARMEEALEVLHKLWKGGVVEHHGEFYDFEPLELSPVPSGPVPIWGGGTSEIAFRRAASRMDGWTSTIQTTADLHEFVPKLEAYRRTSPRAGQPFDICAAVEDAFTLDAYRELGELGVTHLITVPWLLYGVRDDDVRKKCDALKRFGDEVISRQ